MLRYKIIKQRNALDENKAVIFYPRLTQRQKCGFNELASQISDQTSLSKADIGATLIALEKAVPDLLKRGFTVKLGDLGTFSLHASTSTSPSESEVSSRNFRKLNTRFRVGKVLKLLFKDVKLKKI